MPLAHSTHFPVCLDRATGISTQRYRWIQVSGSAVGRFSAFFAPISLCRVETQSRECRLRGRIFAITIESKNVKLPQRLNSQPNDSPNKSMTRLHATLLFFSVCVLPASGCSRSSPQFKGKVIGVADGDTIRVLVNREEKTVRLEGIDAPETRQSFGNQSKRALSQMVFGRDVSVLYSAEDRAGRIVGMITMDGDDINAKMIEQGWAWHYREYGEERRFAELERKAKSAKLGIWADPNPLPPWEFRARQKREQGETPTRFWLNLSSNVRHNQNCEHFRKGKAGRMCGPNEGRACGICGG
jgi:micrococcal nuclease